MREDHHVEPLEHSRRLDFLIGNSDVRHTKSFEGVAHPPLILRRNPRVHDRDARQRDRVRFHCGFSRRNRTKSKCRKSGANRRCVGHEERAGGVAGAADREGGVGNANARAGNFPWQNRRAPVTKMRHDQRGTGTGYHARHHRVGRQHPHRLREHCGICDLERGDVPQQIHRPAGIVVRLWITRLEALQRQHRARELRVRLVETHDPVADFNLHGILARLERERLRGFVHFGALRTEQIHHFGRFCRTPLSAWHHERVRRRPNTASDRALSLGDGVLQISLAIVGDVAQCDEHTGLLVVHVAADAPFHTVDRRIGAIPLHRCGGGWKRDTVDAIGAARRVRLIEAADGVVQVGNRQAVVRRPAIVELIREHTR